MATVIRAHTRRVIIDHESAVGEVRRLVRVLLRDRASDEERDKAVVVASEMARNIVHHADRGEVLLTLMRSDDGCCLDISAVDVPVLAPGPPPRGRSLGLGLETIRRATSAVEWQRTRSDGVLVWARMGTLQVEGPWHFTGLLLPREGEVESGDTLLVRLSTRSARVAVIDGLGHGLLAARAADRAASAIADGWQCDLGPVQTDMQRAGEALDGQRGAAVHVLDLDLDLELARSVSVGNVTAYIEDEQRRLRALVNSDGLVKGTVRRHSLRTAPFKRTRTALVRTDGVRQRAVHRMQENEPIPVRLRPAFLHSLGRRPEDDCAIVALEAAPE